MQWRAHTVSERSSDRMSGEALLERVADIARGLAAAATLDETLQCIVDLGGHYIEGCESASVTFVQGRVLRTPVFSSPLARDLDQFQYETQMGPCLQAIAEHETVLVHDLEGEDRWHEWRRQALDRGVRSSISFRLFLEDGEQETMGALNMYAAVPRAFDARSQAVGQVFASHAAVALKAAITEAGLEQALASRDMIGQAKGILMEREGLPGVEAFDRLRQLSDDRKIPVADLAHRIVADGELPR